MNEKTLAASWLSYAAILPATASTTQVRETRRAFYAGAQAFLGIVCAGIDPGPEPPTDDDLRVLTLLQLELEMFALDIGKGLA